MPRENIDSKGRRLLTEGRLEVIAVIPGEIRATCRGDSGQVYQLGFYSDDWACNCPAKGRCSHLVALQLVTTAPKPVGGEFPTVAPATTPFDQEG